MFESIRWILDNIFGISGNGFVIRENVSPENIETCNGVAVKDDKTRTCALCVAWPFGKIKIATPLLRD